MLQPRNPSLNQQLMTARILWGALTMSMIVYGLVLVVIGRISRIEELSNIPNTFQFFALMANTLGLVVYYLYKNKIAPEKNFQNRFPFYIICWALDEAIVLVGFAAVLLTEDGNGLLYATNLLVGLTANVLCFPRKE